MSVFDALLGQNKPLPTLTPESIKRERAIAEAMLQQGMDYSPIRSPWQGAARLANALVGNYKNSRADEMESKARSESNSAIMAALLGQGAPSMPSPSAPSAVPSQNPPQVNSAPGKIYSNDEPSPLDPPSGEDRQKMIATILGEAANQGATGQNAVASVIRNRAVNGGFGGDTPGGVVTARNQFEPWNTPEGRARMERASADPAQRAAAEQAIAMAYGEGGAAPNDPTGGATMFYSPKVQAALGRTAPSWAQGPGQDIGDHRFYGGTQAPYQVAGPPVAAPQGAAPQAPQSQPQPAINPALIKALQDPWADPTMKSLALHQVQQTMKPETTDEIKEYSLAKKQGFEGSFYDYKSGLKKAGAQNITIDQKPQLAFDQEAGKLQANRFNDITAEGQSAKQMISDINTLTDLGKNIGTGKTAEVKAALGPYADALGVKVEGLSDIQAYEAIVNRLAPSLRVKGSGAQSDLELKNFLKSLPSLGNTPEGNAIAGEVLKGLQENKIAASEIASKALTGEIPRSQAEKMLRELPDPMENYRKFMKANRGAETAKPAVKPSGKTSGGLQWSVE